MHLKRINMEEGVQARIGMLIKNLLLNHNKMHLQDQVDLLKEVPLLAYLIYIIK